MKRWCITAAICLMMMVPSVCLASSEVRLSSDNDGWWAEVWYDGALFIRFVMAESMAVWRAEDDDKTVQIAPLVEGGMLKLIVR